MRGDNRERASEDSMQSSSSATSDEPSESGGKEEENPAPKKREPFNRHLPPLQLGSTETDIAKYDESVPEAADTDEDEAGGSDGPRRAPGGGLQRRHSERLTSGPNKTNIETRPRSGSHGTRPRESHVRQEVSPSQESAAMRNPFDQLVMPDKGSPKATHGASLAFCADELAQASEHALAFARGLSMDDSP